MLINDIFSVFRAGKELANAETWKKRQVLVNALVALLTAGVAIAAAFGYPLNLDSQDVQTIAAAIAALVGVFNGAATVATTTRIGLPPKANDSPGDGTDTKPAVDLHPFDADVFNTRDRA